MNVQLRAYNPDVDFLRVHDFLSETAQVGSGLTFYESIGFRKICVSFC